MCNTPLVVCAVQSLGQLGRVSRMENSGSILMKVNGRQWLMHPSCLIPAPGELPLDEMSTKTPM